MNRGWFCFLNEIVILHYLFANLHFIYLNILMLLFSHSINLSLKFFSWNNFICLLMIIDRKVMMLKIECLFCIVDIRILHCIKLFINYLDPLINLFLKLYDLFSFPQFLKSFDLSFIFLWFILFKNNSLLLNFNLLFNQTFSVVYNWRQNILQFVFLWSLVNWNQFGKFAWGTRYFIVVLCIGVLVRS